MSENNQEELTRLQKENEQLRQENEALKNTSPLDTVPYAEDPTYYWRRGVHK